MKKTWILILIIITILLSACEFPYITESNPTTDDNQINSSSPSPEVSPPLVTVTVTASVTSINEPTPSLKPTVSAVLDYSTVSPTPTLASDKLTVTPAISSDATIYPTATQPPELTSTQAPKPTATQAPKPTATQIPKPTSTQVPKPTSTQAPKPTATQVPKPTSTQAPTPTSLPVYTDPLPYVTFYIPPSSLPAGNSGYRFYAINPDTEEYLQGTYNVSDTSIAVISNTGVITAKVPGTVEITLLVASRSRKITLTITNTATYAYLSGNTSGLSSTESEILDIVTAYISSYITSDMNEYDKVKAVHDYIVLNTEYDMTYYETGVVPDSSYQIEGVLLKHVAVCQGYADTFQMFMNCLGIESIVATGTANGILHAWNLVKLDNEWYHVDTTFDDPVPDIAGSVSYLYFLVPDSSMIGTHTIDAGFPACTATYYTYYRYRDNIVPSIADYESKFAELYNLGMTEITVMYPEFETPDFVTIISHYYHGEIGYYPIYKLGDYTVFTVLILE